MKHNFLKLHRIFRFTNLKPQMFFSIDCNADRILLLGHFTPELTKILKPYFKSQTIDCNGFLNFNRPGLNITLT